MKFKWNLPIDWCHAGIAQGNGLFGSMLFGDCRRLKISFNRADYWYHTEGLSPDKEQSYDNLKKFLLEGEEKTLRTVFEGSSDSPKSTRLPMGRLDIILPKIFKSGNLKLNILNSLGEIKFKTAHNDLKIRTIIPRALPVIALDISGEGAELCKFVSVPSDTKSVKKFYVENNFQKFNKFDVDDGCKGGWIQKVPGDKALCVYWEKVNNEIFLSAVLDENSEVARKLAIEIVKKAAKKGFEQLLIETICWWKTYWEATPEIDIPDREIFDLYYLGMYKMAGMCAPGTPPATLQGPWCEDDIMPPWSSDYHFNINVQECYWPVFASNHPDFILPLFDILKSWAPILKEYAKNFVNVDDGQMLPHAVDDRGVAMGGFWAGHVDHSSTSWVAQLMWLYWKYTVDYAFLKETLYPFMRATMNVYDAMLEEDANGDFFLAVETSPEYNGGQFNAWGKNSSIHLASIHFLAHSLMKTVEILKIDDTKYKRWEEILKKLPISSISSDNEICIWDDQPLAEGHRHFSHLASLHPYDLLDWRTDKQIDKMLKQTLKRWIEQGMEKWAGWSYPWASIIYSRLGDAESSHIMLSIYRRLFMRDDYALRHLPEQANSKSIYNNNYNKIMQIEGGMASAAAVMEMLIHTSKGIMYPLSGVPCYWKNLSFKNILTEGAFLVSCNLVEGKIKNLCVTSKHGGMFKIALPKGKFCIKQDSEIEFIKGKTIYSRNTQPGDKIVFESL